MILDIKTFFFQVETFPNSVLVKGSTQKKSNIQGHPVFPIIQEKVKIKTIQNIL